MSKALVLVRHGQSEFNARNLFTGWADPPLTEIGVQEANAVSDRLEGLGMRFDAAFSSALRRSRQTTEIILDRLGGPEGYIEDAALNERDYGDLTGLNKTEAASRWGGQQVRRWRRSYAEAPPKGESLRDTAARALSFYLRQILPCVMRDETTLVVAHGNSLRALIMTLDDLTPEAISNVELATGEVRLYHLAADTTVEHLEILAA
jgi:2,3-bisphosphoglycerate-dependent phosphoglycerate mutase